MAVSIRLGGLSPGMHTVTITANGDGPVLLDWVAGDAARGPRVVLGTLPRLKATGYAMFPPLNHGSDAAVTPYNAMYVRMVSQMRIDGLDVQTARVNQYFQVQGDVGSDQGHPDDRGDRHIADAFFDALQRSNTGGHPG